MFVHWRCKRLSQASSLQTRTSWGYYIDNKNHSTDNSNNHPNQNCAYLYSILKYLDTKDYNKQNELFKSEFWNDTISIFNFVAVKDSLKRRCQYSNEDTSSLDMFYPTLKLKLKTE